MYAKRYSYESSTTFVIAIITLMFIGIMYVFFAKNGYTFASFVLVSLASLTVIYWAIYLKRTTKNEIKFKYDQKEAQESKSWVYDLIKSDNEVVFVAEVPGPEDVVSVRLVNSVLYIRGGQGFVREVPLDISEEMGIAEFRYRNGILTLKIRRL